MDAIRGVRAIDGAFHVEIVGLDGNHVREWNPVLRTAEADLDFWSRIWQRRNGRAGTSTVGSGEWDSEYSDDPDRGADEWEDDEAIEPGP